MNLASKKAWEHREGLNALHSSSGNRGFSITSFGSSFGFSINIIIGM